MLRLIWIGPNIKRRAGQGNMRPGRLGLVEAGSNPPTPIKPVTEQP